MNMEIIIISISLLFPVLLICKDFFVSKQSYPLVSSESFFSKSQTDWLRGIAIILIMYSHYYTILDLNGKINGVLFQLLSCTGMYGVALFLLMSGYATMISKTNKANYLHRYIPKRLLRLYVPFIIVFIIMAILRMIHGEGLTLKNILLMPLMSLPDTINWYLKVQLALYIVFYLAARFIKNDKWVIVSIFIICFVYMIIGLITHIDAYWYESSYMFPLGMLMAKYKDSLFRFLSLHFPVKIIASLLLAVVFYVPYYLFGGPIPEIIHIFGITQFMVCLCVKMRGTSKILSFFGQCSLELYLSHAIYLGYIRKYFDLQENVLTYLLFMASSVLFAYAVKKLSNLLISVMNKKLIN